VARGRAQATATAQTETAPTQRGLLRRALDAVRGSADAPAPAATAPVPTPTPPPARRVQRPTVRLVEAPPAPRLSRVRAAQAPTAPGPAEPAQPSSDLERRFVVSDSAPALPAPNSTGGTLARAIAPTYPTASQAAQALTTGQPVTLSRFGLSDISAAASSVASGISNAASSAAGAVSSALGGGGGAGGGSGGGGGGADSDKSYNEIMHRLREEQEQLGQLIQHPF
jgi:hypothetical protein